MKRIFWGAIVLAAIVGCEKRENQKRATEANLAGGPARVVDPGLGASIVCPDGWRCSVSPSRGLMASNDALEADVSFQLLDGTDLEAVYTNYKTTLSNITGRRITGEKTLPNGKIFHMNSEFMDWADAEGTHKEVKRWKHVVGVLRLGNRFVGCDGMVKADEYARAEKAFEQLYASLEPVK